MMEKDKYESYETESDKVVIYDLDNPLAWTKSDYHFSIENIE